MRNIPGQPVPGQSRLASKRFQRSDGTFKEGASITENGAIAKRYTMGFRQAYQYQYQQGTQSLLSSMRQKNRHLCPSGRGHGQPKLQYDGCKAINLCTPTFRMMMGVIQIYDDPE